MFGALEVENYVSASIHRTDDNEIIIITHLFTDNGLKTLRVVKGDEAQELHRMLLDDSDSVENDIKKMEEKDNE